MQILEKLNENGSTKTTRIINDYFLGYGKTSLLASIRGEKLWGNLVAWQHNVVQSIVFTMKVPDRPGDISILTHIYVSDNRTVTLNILFKLI